MLAAVSRRRRLCGYDPRQIRRDARRRFQRDAPQPRLRAQRSMRGHPGSPAPDVREVPLRPACRRGFRRLGQSDRLRVAPRQHRHRGIGVSVLDQAEISAGAAPATVLRWAFETFPRVVIVASFQAESSVLIDMASRVRENVNVLTLDTGRLPQQTYDMIDRVRDRYGIEVQVVSPDAADLQDMVETHGANLFYKSVEMRRLCCEVRKSRPLARALKGYDAWVTGLRREQAATRS